MTLWRSTNARQSRNAMARRLVMLLAIVICVRANRWVGTRGGVLGVQRLLGDPPLEPDQWRECAARETDLLEEPGDEDGAERRWVADEGVEGAADRRRIASRWWRGSGEPTHLPQSISPSRSTVRSVMRRTLSIRPRRSIAGIAQSSPIDSGDDPLERLDEEIDVLEVDPALGVRDQRDRELVHPRIPRERTLRQLGQLAGNSPSADSPAPRGCAPGRRDSCRAATLPRGRRPFRRPRHPRAECGHRRAAAAYRRAGSGERCCAPPAPAARETLASGDGAGTIAEMLGAEQLTADRSGEQLFACVGVGAGRSVRRIEGAVRK